MSTVSPPTKPHGAANAAAISQRLQHWWQARMPRERKMIVLAAIIVLGGAVVGVADWIAAERARLARSLPAARLAYLSMEQDSLALAALRERPQPAPAALATVADSVSAAARVRNIQAETRVSGNVLAVSGSTDLAALVDWLGAVQTEFRLRPTQLEMQPAGADGRARFELRLEAARN